MFVSRLFLTKHYKCITTTMNKGKIDEMMDGQTLGTLDAVRLVLECIEAMGREAEGLSRLAMLESVRRVMRAGIAAVRAELHTEAFEKVAWASIAARSGRRPSTTRDLRHYVRRMLRVEGVAQMPLRSMKVAQCRHILQQAFGSSISSYRKGRAILHSIFAYGMRQEWCDTNPVARIEAPRVQEHPIVPLNHDEVNRLRRTVSQREFADMRFSLSLLLYSGVRPAEVGRITPQDVCWEEQQVIIRPQSSKTGGGRVVPLRAVPGLREQDCRIPRNWQQRWLALRRAAGFDHWVPDACRHTFASYHAAHFRNLPELQLEMGHRDSSLLRSRYLSPALRKTAAAFWKNAKLKPVTSDERLGKGCR